MAFVAPAQPQREILRRLLKDYALPNVGAMALGALFLAFSGLSNVGVAWLLKPIVDGFMAADAFYQMRWVAVSAWALFIVRGATTLGALYVLSRLGNRIIASVQKRAFDNLLVQNLA